MQNLTILGSTGSIGTQALDVVRCMGKVKINALTAHSRTDVMENQIRQFSPDFVVMTDERSAADLKTRIADTSCRVLTGSDALVEAASCEKSDTVLNSIVGIAGLVPTMAAIKAKKRIALANKETLVAAGKLVMQSASDNNVPILPVDSEHSAIFQCLQGVPEGSLKRILLTASGGPFRGKTADEMKQVTPQQALNHPNWSMGAKITIDSATMMNKGLELIEAVHLFNVKPSQVQIVVHPQSVIHSMIELTDNSVLAQMGVPDMRIPIQYALTYPERIPCPVEQLDLFSYGTISFFPPDFANFKCLDMAYKAINAGGLHPCVMNGANEAAVSLFLNNKIPFTAIGELVSAAMDNLQDKQDYTIDHVLEADKTARQFVFDNFERL